MTEEVVVHAPQEFGPKNAAGVGVLKPIARKDTKMSPLVIVGIVSGIITVLVVAVLLRSLGTGFALGAGPVRVCSWPRPLVLGGYTFLRDDGVGTLPRPVLNRASVDLWSVVCRLVGRLRLVARLWHSIWSGWNCFILLLIVPPIIAAGAFVAPVFPGSGIHRCDDPLRDLCAGHGRPLSHRRCPTAGTAAGVIHGREHAVR